MTINDPERLRLGDELDRLAERVNELEAQAEDADDSASGDALRWSVNELDQQGAAVAELIDRYGADAEVVVEPLDAGTYGRVEDRVASHRERSKQTSVQGYHRVVYAAAGLVDAPFYDAGGPDEDANDPFDARIAAVAGLNPAAAKWLYSRVDVLTTPDQGNWRASAGSQPGGGN